MNFMSEIRDALIQGEGATEDKATKKIKKKKP